MTFDPTKYGVPVDEAPAFDISKYGVVLDDEDEEEGRAASVQSPAKVNEPASGLLPGFQLSPREEGGDMSFGGAVGRGVDQVQGMTGGFIEATGELVGSRTIGEYGKDIRERNDVEAAQYGPGTSVSDIDGVGSFAQWVKETVGTQIPMMAPSLAGGAAGAVAGSFIPGIGTAVGGIIGAFVPSLILGTGEVQANIKERGGTNPGMAFAGGSAIAALDSVLPGKIGGALAKRFGKETAEKIATETLSKPVKERFLKRTAKGAVSGMLTEGFTEALQEAIGDNAAAVATNQDLSPELGKQMIEAGAAGALMGVFGGGIGAQFKGEREKAAENATKLTPEDEASPLDNDDIIKGRQAQADAAAVKEANNILDQLGAPKVNARVEFTQGKNKYGGVVLDAFRDENGQPGMKFKLDGGHEFSLLAGEIYERGIAIREVLKEEQWQKVFAVDPKTKKPTKQHVGWQNTVTQEYQHGVEPPAGLGDNFGFTYTGQDFATAPLTDTSYEGIPDEPFAYGSQFDVQQPVERPQGPQQAIADQSTPRGILPGVDMNATRTTYGDGFSATESTGAPAAQLPSPQSLATEGFSPAQGFQYRTESPSPRTIKQETVEARGGQQFRTDKDSGWAPQPVLRKDGSVFSSEAGARQAARARSDLQGQNLVPVEYQGGWALMAVGRRQEVQGVNPKTPQGAQPQARPASLIEWIADSGGIMDEGGELAAMDAGNKFMPGRGKFVRNQNGRAPDYVREAAVEMGYLPEGATLNDLWDAIRREMAGERIVADSDVAAEQDYQAAQQEKLNAEDEAAFRDEIKQIAKMAGTIIPESEVQAVMDVMASNPHFDAEEAYYYYEEEQALYGEGETSYQTPAPEVDDIPFFGDEQQVANGTTNGQSRPTGGETQASGTSEQGSGARSGTEGGGRKPATQDPERSEEASESDSRPEQADREPDQDPGVTKIGVNSDGFPIYEDEHGVRFYVENGFEITESVAIIPGKGVVVDTANRDEQFIPVEDGNTDGEVDEFTALLQDIVDDEFGAESQTNSETVDTVDGPRDQSLIPGVDPVTDKDKAEVQASKPKTSSKPQKPMNIGLFDEDGQNQGDMFDAPKGPRSAGEAAQSAAQNTIKGMDQAANALWELFGKGKRLNSGLSFDEETYAKAKPIFLEAIKSFKDAGGDIADLVRALVRSLKNDYGFNSDTIMGMAPYLKRFTEEYQATANDNTVEEATDSDLEVLANAFDEAFAEGRTFATITQARKFAEEVTGKEYKPGTPEVKALEEAIEAGLVKRSRAIVREMGGEAYSKIYDRLVALYQAQPNLAERTSTSIENQAYSTPAPLAYLANRLAGVNDSKTVLEPSAGNGMLLMEASPENIVANELNPDRVRALELALGEKADIRTGDAMAADFGGPFDVVIENPPFGKVKDDQGETVRFPMASTQTTEIDHAIAMKSLASMHDNGRAVLIIGGQRGTDAERKKGYQGDNNRKFFKELYDNYNVTQHFTADGSLYRKQGAGWPVDVIVIEGVGVSDLDYPMKTPPQVHKTWDELRGLIDDSAQDSVGPTGGRRPSNRGGDTQPDGQQTSNVSDPSSRVGDKTGPFGDGSRPGGGDQTVVDGGAPREPNSDQSNSGGRRPSGDGKRPGDGNVDGDRANGPVNNDGRPNAAPNSQGPNTGKPDNGDVPRTVKRNRQNDETETAFQVQYAPRSEAEFAVGTLVPRNMQAAIDIALDVIEEKHGSVDEFVARELDYSLEDMLGTEERPGYFSAEQVDALAMAIANVSDGAGFIIGDQTGVGKGRFVAAMLRWAMLKGKVPVFMTKDAGLFADMIRDMRDIGMAGIESQIFVTDKSLRNKKAIPIGRDHESNERLEAPKPKVHKDGLKAMAQGGMPEGYSMVFTTYSQMQQVKGKDTPRHPAMTGIASNAMFVLDESHLAGGTGEKGRKKKSKGGAKPLPRSEFIRQLLAMSEGVVYSSATYAKNPDVMSLYFKTDISIAVKNPSLLAEAIKAGGVPLQQVTANMLVESGQYARRERSYEGVEMDLDTLDVDMGKSDDLAGAVQDIFNLDRDLMERVREKFIEQIKESGFGAASHDFAVGENSSFSQTPFANTMHNVVGQVLLALKVPAVVQQAIEAHKRGEKPIIALMNTNESIITDFIKENGHRPGDDVTVPFNEILRRYLHRLRRVTLKNGDDKVFHFISDDEIRVIAGQDGLDMVRALERQIDAYDFGEIPASPIDYILDKLREAGINADEITGRGQRIRNGIYEVREGTQAEKKRAMNAYNSGELDALVLNSSGSTGYSMHATDRPGNDGKQRRMIILQPDPNIDTFMQMLGRIHRTGQTVLPKFTIAVSNLASEKRLAANLMRKMASLNANTTASKKSAVSLDNVTDFMNKYGDEVVATYLRENDGLAASLGIWAPSEVPKDGSLANKFTGRISILPADEVAAIYDDIESAYNHLIQNLDRAGKNDLEAKTLDLQAETIKSEMLRQGKDQNSPFGRDAILETVRARKLGKPYTLDEVAEQVTEAFEVSEPKAVDERLDQALEEYRLTIGERIQKTDDDLEAAKTEAQKDRATDTGKRLRAQLAAADGKVDDVKDLAQKYRPGAPVAVTIRDEGDAVQILAYSLGVDASRLKGNPTALSKIVLRLAVADAGRELQIPLSQVLGEDPRYSLVAANKNAVDFAFETGISESREQRQIITGNLLSGFSEFGKGQITMFTDADGRIRQGILMPKDFDAASALTARPVEFNTVAEVFDFIDEGHKTGDGPRMVKNSASIVSLQRTPNGRYSIAVKVRGGKPYILNKSVRAIVGDFQKRAGAQTYEKVGLYRDEASAVLQEWVDQLEAVFIADAHKEAARKITGQEITIEQSEGAKAAQAAQEQATEETQQTINETTAGVKFKLADAWHAKEQRDTFVATAQEHLGGQEYARVNNIAKKHGGYYSKYNKNGAVPGFQFKTAEARKAFVDEVNGETKHQIEPLAGKIEGSQELNADILRDAFVERLKQVGLDGKYAVKLFDIVKRPDGSRLGGAHSAVKKLIVVSLLDGNGMATLDHEIIHALKALGLFTPTEWKILEAKAKKDKDARAWAEKNYASLDEAGKVEEMVAELFSEAQGIERGTVGRIAKRVSDFMEALGNFLKGNGFKSAQDIYDAINSGEVGQRTPSDTKAAGGLQYQVEPMDRGMFGDPAYQPRHNVIQVLTASHSTFRERLAKATTLDTLQQTLDDLRQAFQDRMLPTLRAQQAISRVIGRDIAENENVYLIEELSSGRKGAKLERLQQEILEPLYLKMHEFGIKVEELEEFLYARHAPERNAYIQSINPDEAKGSGMTDDEAAAVMEAVRAAGKMDQMRELTRYIDRLTKRGLAERVRAGLMTEEQAQTWADRWQYYVPLRGFEDIDPAVEDIFYQRPNAGGGVNIRGAESKRAFGRVSKAGDILANVVMQAEEAILRAETNQIAHALYKLAENAPDPDFWTIDKISTKLVINPQTGLVESRPVKQITAEDKDVTVSLKIDGVEHRVTFNKQNPVALKMAKSLRETDAFNHDAAQAMVNALGQFNRYLSHVNTTLNPEFTITNAFRDLETAGINLGQYDQKGLILATARNYKSAIKASVKANVLKDTNSPWGRMYQRFVNAGGRVYFNQMDDVPKLRKRIEKDFDLATPDVKLRENPALKARQTWRTVFDFIDNMNMGVENAVRLAAFKAAIDAGMTDREAATLAKNLTVNFNRRGALGQIMNSLYLFFNASVQGTAIMFRALKHRRVQKIMGGVVAFGAMNEVLNRMLSDDDDDGESYYDKMDDSIKSRNIVLMLPGTDGDYLKIPLPYGYNAFHHLGRSAIEVAAGRSAGDAAAALLMTTVDAFNPIGGTNSFLNFVAPTIFDPAVDIVTNKDNFGRAIYPEDSAYGSPTPDATKHWSTVSAPAKGITDLLAWMTGGDEVQSGAIDISPETLDYMFGYMTGASGQFYQRNINTIAKFADPASDVTINDIAFARRLYGSKSPWQDKALFYTRVRDAQNAFDEYREYGRLGKKDAAKEYRAENKTLIQLHQYGKNSRKVLQYIRKQKVNLARERDAGKLSKEEYARKIDTLKKREEKTITQFNKRWVDSAE